MTSVALTVMAPVVLHAGSTVEVGAQERGVEKDVIALVSCEAR
jgi:hypothetical protein